MRKNTILIVITIMCVTILTFILCACNETEIVNETTTQTENTTNTDVPDDNVTQTSTDVPTESCMDDFICKKPVIYLYPTKTTQLTVKLGYPNKLTCSYPEYKNEWNITAYPDGTLIDNKTGRELYSLYWEGNCDYTLNSNEGFVVKGSGTVSFLEEKLSILGLNDKEAEEFIIYWLPELQKNEYNFIRFASLNETNQAMPLVLSEEPDTLIRVMMQFKPLNEYTEVKEQKLDKVKRNGFTVVEWGGCKIK